MKRRLTRGDVEAAVYGGLLLSAGGSGGTGADRNRAIGEMALAYSGVDLVDPRGLDDAALAIVVTGVGAPATSRPRTEPRHAIESARLLLHAIDRPVAAVMPAHVPGMNAWLLASVLGLDLLDAATNGRGHPTPTLGAMGLASRPETTIIQTGVGGRRGETPVSIVAKGDFASTSAILRAAASANGGLILAARGPFTIEQVRKQGAALALSYQIDLGRAMLDAGTTGGSRIAAATQFLKGEVLVIGRVVENTVAYNGSLDVGSIVVADRSRIEIGVCNEYMCVEREGQRLFTFPDLIATIDPQTGLALEVSELVIGAEVAVIATSQDQLPLGAGVLEAVAYDEIERAMNTDLHNHGPRSTAR